MDGGGPAVYYPKTVDEVFRDFKGRRDGMIKALTTDFEDFYRLCDPERKILAHSRIRISQFIWLLCQILFVMYVLATDKENLCLYGFPNEEWEVNLPAEEVPPELPEPVLGINFARDGMQEKDWLSLVAVHSDAWLLAVASYFGARFGFDKYDRKRLFGYINDLPTIFEIINGKNQSKASGANHLSNKSKSSSKVQHASEYQHKPSKRMQLKEEEVLEDEDDHGETLCGACSGSYTADEFWIGCDICEKWFHGKCVKITPARAEHIKQYKCPSCNNKRARP